MNLLITLVLVLAVAAFALMMRVSRLSAGVSGRKEEEIDEQSNNRIANGMLIFGIVMVGFLFWLIYAYADQFLPIAATKHGVEIDWLMKYNLYLVVIVFAVFNLIIFGFAHRYRYKKGVKAFFYSHSNKLELIWTVIPSIVMAVIVIAGIFVWNHINDDPDPDAITIQIYGKQFDWTARYAGEDNKLGPSSFNFISGTNPLGVISTPIYEAQLKEIEANIQAIETDLSGKGKVVSFTAEEEMEVKLGRLQRQKVRIISTDKENPDYAFANDDVVVKELVIPVDREINLLINSRDVIHSVFIPHFRLQMNAVPGMTTSFKFTPTITSEQMKREVNDPDFKYVMMCNKICGASHYNMRMEITVVSQTEYEDWLANNDDFMTKQKKLTASAE